MEAILDPARFLPETLPHCKGEHLMVLFSLSKENLSRRCHTEASSGREPLFHKGTPWRLIIRGKMPPML